jgi:hypothetical protein
MTSPYKRYAQINKEEIDLQGKKERKSLLTIIAASLLFICQVVLALHYYFPGGLSNIQQDPVKRLKNEKHIMINASGQFSDANQIQHGSKESNNQLTVNANGVVKFTDSTQFRAQKKEAKIIYKGKATVAVNPTISRIVHDQGIQPSDKRDDIIRVIVNFIIGSVLISLLKDEIRDVLLSKPKRFGLGIIITFIFVFSLLMILLPIEELLQDFLVQKGQTNDNLKRIAVSLYISVLSAFIVSLIKYYRAVPIRFKFRRIVKRSLKILGFAIELIRL